MKKIESKYTSNIFENIKHIDEYVMSFGMRVNYKKYLSTGTGETLRR